MLGYNLGDPFVDPSFCFGNQTSLNGTTHDLVEALSGDVFTFAELE